MSDLAKQIAAKSVEVEQRPRGVTVADLIERQKGEIARALPIGMAPERFARLLLTECRKTPQLLACTPASLLGAMMTAAQLGLEPGVLQHCYLIPRKKRGTPEATFLLGYRGMVELSLRGGRTLSVDAHVVHEHDEFEFAYGTDPRLRHVPRLDERGEPVAVYAVALLATGGKPFVVLSMAEVARRRAHSQAGETGPWSTDFEAMARKSAVRALAPYLPQSAEFAAAQRLDEIVRTDFDVSLDEYEPPEPVENENSGGDPNPGDEGAGTRGVPAPDSPEAVELLKGVRRTKKGEAEYREWCNTFELDPDGHLAWPAERWATFVAWVHQEPEPA